MLVTRQQIVDQARKYLGVKYRDQAFTPPPAFPDAFGCAGVVLRVGIDLGLLPADLRIAAYPAQPREEHFKPLKDHLDPILIDNLKPGDVAVLCHKPEKSLRPAHLAIAGRKTIGQVTQDTLIQVWPYMSINKVSEAGIDAFWQAHIVEAYRFRGVVD